MYLKSLKLVGFKSFADRTHLELRPGVTVIVGPNGSGKSNVVDALSWVMGTQSTKALRTDRMEDVVFAGTATRPALTRAEAIVIIDNSDRSLDLDLDEVAITRRLYRDGSSDYELNGVGCRLLDIQDLLSDSGVGRHQHVIIGQGQVERVLNASPEDHRAVIEEAAGILKHRKRKEKAERRLERTDEDLSRLTDLLGEITRQMRPLKRQATAAEKYQGLKDDATALTLFNAGSSLKQIQTELAALSGEKESLEAELSTRVEEVAGLSTELERLTARAGDLGVDLERDSTTGALLETTAERLRRLASVAHERSRAVSGRRQAADERREDLESELNDLRSELESLLSDEPATADQAALLEERFRSLEAEQHAIATQNALSPEGALAAVRGELSVLEAADLRDQREVEAIQKRIDVVSSQRADELSEVERINSEVKEIDSRISEIQAKYDKARERRTADQDVWTAAEERFTEARMAVTGAEARWEAIRAALDGHFDEEARARVEGSSGAIGSLVSALDVPAGMERAVEAALGEWADAVAFDGVESLESIVESIKSNGLGGVPVVTAMSEAGVPSREVANALGLEALVDVLGPKANTSLSTRLLGDVVLVEGWTAAWRLISKNPALRAVTPEGDLVTVSGIRVANPDGAGVAMLEAAEVGLEKAGTSLARAESRHSAAKRDFESSRQSERTELETLEALEASLAGRTEAMARLQQSVKTLESERERLDARQLSISESTSARDRQIAELRSRLASLEGAEADRMKVWEELESRRVEIAADREVARSAWQESAERLRTLQERKTMHQERVKRIENELGRLDLGVSEPLASTEVLEQVEVKAKFGVETLERRLSELRIRQQELRAANRDALDSLEAERARYEAGRTWIEEARALLAQIDVRTTELRLNHESLAERVRRDADSTVELAVAAPRPDHPEDADLVAMLDSRLAELRRLGPVNPLAAAEYSELKERHDFMTDQMADVESSRHELRKVITALEEEIELRFQWAFTEVAEAYQKYFSILFPGGKGRLRLVEDEDGVAGLEIQAQPLGKKVSQLSLLSGGERSLAALAFLFAVFEARPSPFYVLDEVEAALDDSNLRRFLKIVDEFRLQAQLLIVTHQQQTMEAADVLYGVTMEPGGSSKVVRKAMTGADVTQVA